MDDRPDLRPDRLEMAADEVFRHHARIAGDIVEVGARAWAIHGFIPVDGEVILAEFERRETAKAVLDRLPPSTDTSRRAGP